MRHEYTRRGSGRNEPFGEEIVPTEEELLVPNGVESGIRDSRWARWAPLGGIAFIILFVVGIILFSTPDVDNSPQQITLVL